MKVGNWAIRLVASERHLICQKLLRLGLLSTLLVTALIRLPYASEFYGPEAYHKVFPPGTAIETITRFACYPHVRPWYWLIALIQVAALAGAILSQRYYRIWLLVAYVLTMNLNALCNVVLDGGDNIAGLLMFYLLFVNSSGSIVSWSQIPDLNHFLRCVSNCAFFLCRAQIVLVYAASGMYKLSGPMWQNGTAIYYILQSPYSTPFIRDWVVRHPAAAAIATYSVICFQLSFPFLIWVRRARPWVLCAGLGFHAGIMGCMGLYEFGAIMCISYLAFMPREAAIALAMRFPRRTD